MYKIFFFLFLIINQSYASFFAQQHVDYEHLDDSFLPNPQKKAFGTPAYRHFTPSIITTQVNVNENYNNITNDAANEPSLAIDPNNPLRMVIGWRQFENVESNFRQAGLAYTIDGGLTWENIGPLEPELFRSDPVLDTDSEGNFYYNSLTTSFNCDVFKTSTLTDWNNQVNAFGGDKQWMVIDKTTNLSNGQIYAFWAEPFTVCDGFFTRSVDQGASYENCSTMPLSLRRGTLAVGPESEVYACGAIGSTFHVLKSISAGNPNENISWEQSSIVDLSGSLALYGGPNPSGMLGQIWIATDHSNTETNGFVYLVSVHKVIRLKT